MTRIPCSLGAVGALLLLLCGGCGAPPPEATGDSTEAMSASADSIASNLLHGPWQFVSSDVTPSTSYTIAGDTIDLDFSGYFNCSVPCSSASLQGYTFAQPVKVRSGRTYTLTVAVSNVAEPGIPVVVEASLSGAGAEQEQSITSAGTLTFTFDVASDPGSTPVINLVARPVLGQIGPLTNTGIGIDSYDLSASLTRQ